MKSRMLFQISFLIFCTTTISLSAMFRELHKIDRLLVSREIEARGANALLQEISQAENPRITFDGHKYGTKIPVVLRVEKTFFASDRNTDPLTNAIFQAIENHETQQNNPSLPLSRTSNHLTPETQYFWYHENGNRVPVVRIKAQLVNKPELLKIVQSHTE